MSIRYISNRLGEFPIIEIMESGGPFILDKHLAIMCGRSVTDINRLVKRHKDKFEKSSYKRATKTELNVIKNRYETRRKFPCTPMLYTKSACYLITEMLNSCMSLEAYKSINEAIP